MTALKRKQAMSCGALVYKLINDDVHVLLVRPSIGRTTWGLPKGHINEGESIEDCAKREVLEETGISVELEEVLPSISTSYKNIDKTVIIFLAHQIDSLIPYPNDKENDAVKWFNANELPWLHFYQKNLIYDAIGVIREKINADT